MLAAIKRLLTGDDGQTWAVVVEPSPFRRHESRVCGPFTKRQAGRFARRFVAAEPYGLADVVVLRAGATWPPGTNWETA